MKQHHFKSSILTLGLLVMLSIGATDAQASSVIRTGESVSVLGDQKIEGDFYSAAGKFNVSGEVEEDALVVAGQITINGSIGKDAALIGAGVDVYGTIGDDLRIIAGDATIAEPVMGDLLVIAGTVHLLSTASVAGDVILLAGQATIEGSVGGDIIGRAETLRIDGTVTGNVDVNAVTLTLGDKAAIEGSVSYVSRSVAVKSLNATVGGEMTRNDPIFEPADVSLRSTVLPVLVVLFSVLAWYLVSRKTLLQVTERALIKSPRPIVLGAGILLLAPFAIVMLSVSMIGIFVGAALFFGYGLLVVLGLVGLTAVLGRLLMKLFNKPNARLSLVTILVGVIAVSLLMLLPVIGMLLLMVLFILTMGAIVDLVLRPKI